MALVAASALTHCTASTPSVNSCPKLPEPISAPCVGVSNVYGKMTPVEQEGAWRADRGGLAGCSDKHASVVKAYESCSLTKD